MIGWPDDHQVVGPRAFQAKAQLLQLLPKILPTSGDEHSIYRLVLDHGDFGIHNMAIAGSKASPEVKAVFDWETASIVPALLSDPLMAVVVDLIVDNGAHAAVTRLPQSVTNDKMLEYKGWAEDYVKVRILS